MARWYFDNARFRKDVSIAMKSQDMSYSVLASRMLMTKTMVWRIVRGMRDITTEEMCDMCNILGLVPIEYLDESEVQLRMFR